MTTQEAISNARLCAKEITECNRCTIWGNDDCVAELLTFMADELERAKCEACGYKIHSENISKLNSCNDCGNKNDCNDRPKWGEYCRINCMNWRK